MPAASVAALVRVGGNLRGVELLRPATGLVVSRSVRSTGSLSAVGAPMTPRVLADTALPPSTCALSCRDRLCLHHDRDLTTDATGAAGVDVRTPLPTGADAVATAVNT